jgi:hypothetical protein
MWRNEMIKREGKLFVFSDGKQEAAHKELLGLIRLLCRLGMSHVQAAFLYTNARAEFLA